MSKIRNPQDILVALLFIAVGVAGLVFGRDYAVGAAGAMGPGYLPRLLSIAIVGVGVIVGLGALKFEGPPLDGMGWRPLLLVTSAIAFFGLSVDRLGLVVATIGAVLIGGFASREIKAREVVLVAIALAIFCTLVFVWALGQTIPVWPR